MPNTRTNATHSALVFDMRSLSRQAGSARTRKLTVPAPADLRLELARVPVGADMDLDVRFEAVTEGILVTASVTAPLAGECARCLTPVDATVTASFTELYLYPDGHPHDGRRAPDKHDKYDKYHKHERRGEGDKRDDEERLVQDEERYLDKDLLDLEPALRDAVVLALPMSPLCRADCPGLCVECGVPLAEAGPGHRHERAPDPRWAALQQLDDQATTPNGRHAGAIDLQEG